MVELFLAVVPTADKGGKAFDEDIRRAQQVGNLSSHWTKDCDRIIKVEGNAWIPEEPTDLKLTIMIKGHCSSKVRKGKKATRNKVRESTNRQI